ncbi:hypothetical protein EWM64_g6362 [Hericium alpestre]|uniref:Xylanolytic transcriptional activator regulatory domain-containing protein n=1 Tax=Hericium alpestre TaxID=135208 RepID=A0A4Y9ZUW6_9AGAM|nr:hypothetical protein EWM64_g6362 [Hericium alpestre]
MCDNCVDGCDHHCQWVNNCVGRRNYTYFFAFITSAALTLCLVIVTSALHIYLVTRRDHVDFSHALNEAAGSAVVFSLSIVVVWPVAALLSYHMRLLILNVTTIEQIRNQAHKSLVPGPAPPNPFGHGNWRRNLADVLCRPVGYSWVEPHAVATEDKREINPGMLEDDENGRYEGEASRPANIQPYPSYHIMSPSSYPSAASPFPYNSSTNGNSPTVGPGISGHPPPQSHYPPYPSSYPATHPYSAYATQYAPQMMVYGPSRPAAQPDPTTPAAPLTPTISSPASATHPATGKRKRKSVPEGPDPDRSDGEAGGSGSDVNRPSAGQNSSSSVLPDIRKRTKTQRACDSCRSRKIRFVRSSHPPACVLSPASCRLHPACTTMFANPIFSDRCDILVDADPPVCQHCKQYGFDCTFFLPIAETRFKKKKLEEEAAAERTRLEALDRRTSSTPHGELRQADARVCGPTSEAHLLHSSATIPSRLYENYDLRHHHTWEVTQSGDGLIQVTEPQTDDVQLALPKPIDMRIERDVIEKLVNAYFTEIAPVLPVVTQAEFLANPSAPPILLYSICLVAAARREVPQSVFDSIRYAVNTVIKGEDVLSTASIVNVQSLLILCMVGDCHSQFVPNALSAMWIRLGTAIRMAQDLGLHRVEAVKQNIELRRRLWGACVISDRWMSLSYGHPYMIDVNDCDARLPSSGDPNDVYVDELVRLSIILGRVLKTIYSPSGLTFTNDEQLQALLTDIEDWRKNLPESLQFKGPDTPGNAGLLFLMYSCVSMIFWRVFMRISYSCPVHLKFGLTVEQWSALVKLTGDAIDWLDKHDHMYDVWLMVAYAATSCALVQYHTWARRQDQEAAFKLKKLRDCIRRWEKSLSPDHMSARRKTAEIIALLYEATQGAPPPIETPALNPTGGVKGKLPPPLGGLQYEKDPSRPGGGIFVAHGKQAKGAYMELGDETVIDGSDSDEEVEGAVLPRGDVSSSSAPAAVLATASAPVNTIVHYTPLGSSTIPGAGNPNVNPALNDSTGIQNSVHVMNLLDGTGTGAGGGALEQYAMAENSWLDGIPGGMFDWVTSWLMGHKGPTQISWLAFPQGHIED